MEVDDERVRLADFRGPGWDSYAWELACCGYAVMMAWLTTGEIFHQCYDGGATLKTYFIDTYVFTFPNLYRK